MFHVVHVHVHVHMRARRASSIPASAIPSEHPASRPETQSSPGLTPHHIIPPPHPATPLKPHPTPSIAFPIISHLHLALLLLLSHDGTGDAAALVVAALDAAGAAARGLGGLHDALDGRRRRAAGARLVLVDDGGVVGVGGARHCCCVVWGGYGR